MTTTTQTNGGTTTTSRPFHLMSAAEQTALRIAQNRAIDANVARARHAVALVTTCPVTGQRIARGRRVDVVERFQVRRFEARYEGR